MESMLGEGPALRRLGPIQTSLKETVADDVISEEAFESDFDEDIPDENADPVLADQIEAVSEVPLLDKK